MSQDSNKRPARRIPLTVERWQHQLGPLAERSRHWWQVLEPAVRKTKADGLVILSAALAFLTMLSLVPLLAALSKLSLGLFAGGQSELIRLLSRILPYSRQEITEALGTFLAQSNDLQGFSFLIFLVTVLTTFLTIDKTLNDIWHVPGRRSLRSKMNSFILLLCWGPVALGLAYSSIYFLRSHRAFEIALSVVPVQLLTFGVTALALSGLYWQVPQTRVRFRSAFLGGFTAALLLEVLRATFGLYVKTAYPLSVVYGSFGLALLFMISVQLAWTIVLLGAVVSYCDQHFTLMTRTREQPVEGGWLALAGMLRMLESVRQHEPLTTHAELAEAVCLPTENLRRLLKPLVEAGYLRENLKGLEGYLLSCDPYQTPVLELLELYELRQWRVLIDLSEGNTPLSDIRDRLRAARRPVLGDIMLADLLPAANSQQDSVPVTAPLPADASAPKGAAPETVA